MFDKYLHIHNKQYITIYYIYRVYINYDTISTSFVRSKSCLTLLGGKDRIKPFNKLDIIMTF